jgi:hypothetical protein
MSSIPEVFAVDCTEAAVHVVRLAIGERLLLIEQLTLKGIQEFHDYWGRILSESPWICIVAEDYPNDPAGVLPLIQQRYRIDRQFVKFREAAYQLPFRELGIELKYQRAGALALNKANQIQASALARDLMDRISELQRNLNRTETEAARLFLALTSSISDLTIPF